MEEPHARFFEAVFGCEAKCFAEVAEQHVGATDGQLGFLIGSGDRLFHQALAHADTKVANHHLDGVFRFQRGALPQQRAHLLQLGRRAASCGDVVEQLCQIGKRENRSGEFSRP